MQLRVNPLSSLSVDDVSVAEQFVLGTCRCWDAFTAHPDATLPWRNLAPVFAYMNVLSAMCAFERLFAVLASTQTRRPRFSEADSPWIDADEARVLCAVAALQDADARGAVQVLRGVLEDSQVRVVLPPLARIASILAGQGHCLPRRTLSPVTSPPRRWPASAGID